MSAAWIVYALAVAVVLTLAALAAEQGARLARRAGRWVWALAMLLTVALPLLAPGPAPRPEPGSLAGPLAHSAPAARPTLAAGGFQATPSLTPRAWLPERATQAGAIDLDAAARIVWPVASALALAVLAGAAMALRRRQRQWRPARLAGADVLVSDDAGPAVVGVLRPRIVVPAWLLDAPPRRQALVLAHEQSHIDAGDQRLLAAVALLLVAMPWNLPLWFQLRRLRRAIEVDCDARVLAAGHPLAEYGATLIDVGARGESAHPPMPLFVAMAAPAPFLEQRLRLMTRRPAFWQRLLAPLLLLLSIDIGVAAARIAPPPAVAVAVATAPAGRAALAGYYQLGANRVAVVTVSAAGLTMKTNLEAAWPLLAESDDAYFVPGTDLRVRFDRAAGTLTLSLSGAAADPAPRTDSAAVERADAYVTARISSGQPRAGGDVIVRRNVGARQVGQLHAADFTPGLLRQASALMPLQRHRNEAMGSVQQVDFDGVDRLGWDRYKVRYANGTLHWAIWLDADGHLAAATLAPPLR
jgi:bla regulator protein BlaR1